MTTSFAVYFFSSEFSLFVIAELISALGTTFISGALDAWIIDRLEDKNYGGRVDFVFSQANIISKFAGLVGGLLGAYLAAKSLALPFGLASLISAITIIFSLFMIQRDRNNQHKEFSFGFNKMGQIARDSVSFGLRHPVLFWLVLSSALTMFAYMPLNMFWSPRLSSLAGGEIAILGWVWVGFVVITQSGTSWATRNRACSAGFKRRWWFWASWRGAQRLLIQSRMKHLGVWPMDCIYRTRCYRSYL
jgi:hypothetical protein